MNYTPHANIKQCKFLKRRTQELCIMPVSKSPFWEREIIFIETLVSLHLFFSLAPHAPPHSCVIDMRVIKQRIVHIACV